MIQKYFNGSFFQIDKVAFLFSKSIEHRELSNSLKMSKIDNAGFVKLDTNNKNIPYLSLFGDSVSLSAKHNPNGLNNENTFKYIRIKKYMRLNNVFIMFSKKVTHSDVLKSLSLCIDDIVSAGLTELCLDEFENASYHFSGRSESLNISSKSDDDIVFFESNTYY